jgi:hypothetical protein
MSWEPQVVRTVDLGYEQLLVLESQRGAVIRVVHGGVWLTQEGLARDVFAETGAEVPLKEGGRVVVEGLGAARLQLVEAPVSAAWERLRAAVHSFLSGLRLLRERGQLGRAGEPAICR